MEKLIFILIFIALLSTLARADYSCINDTHTNFSTTIKVSGTSIPVNYEEYCPFNCTNTTGECNIVDPMSSSLYGIALLIVSALFIVAAVKSSSGFVFHGLNIEFLQPLFFTLAFFLILTSFTIMISGSKASTVIYGLLGSGYNVTMWVFIFFISFMVLSFIVNLLQNRLKEAERGGRK